MQELVILSGKGGTGKTSFTAAFASLAGPVTLADCDVDAADLHLVVAPRSSIGHPFVAGWEAVLDQSTCLRCGKCAALCRFGAIVRENNPERKRRIDPFACEGCGVCAHACPAGAITMVEPLRGMWYRSDTRFGTMFHAQLDVGAENSGKLVTLLRREARAVAESVGAMLLTDGPPGIGCAAIATLSGADHVLFIAEPTTSGLHDLRRAAQLAASFRITSSVVINKADLSPETSRQILAYAREAGLEALGEVPFDPAVTQAQVAGLSITEFGQSAAADAIRNVWDRLSERLASTARTNLKLTPRRPTT